MSFGITKATLDFERIREIGQQGKNSNVYLAHDKQLDAELVIKKIEKKRILNPAEFYAEAKRLYDSEHQHVVQIKYACEDTDHIYLAMPFYKNGSLKTLIDSRHLTTREIIRYSIQFLSGLHNIHVKQLIHFDVKPDNILLSDSNEALISDFGLTKNMNAFGMTAPDQFYRKQVPPEAFSQTQHSMLYDIYNAGLTIYRLCNGNRLYYDQFARYPDKSAYAIGVQSGAFPDRSIYLPHIPKALRKAINKAINIDQSKRHQTILELINDLSPVNQLLDWKYEQMPNKQLWVLEDNGKRFSVTLTGNGSIFDLETHKTIIASSNVTRVSAGCKNKIAITDIDKVVQDVLLSLS